MNLLERTKFLLRRYDVRPRRRLGQNFCVDSRLLENIVKYSSIDSDDIVLEVGAGFGFLTELLSETVKEVIAVEVDAKLVRALHDQFADRENIRIIEGDVLKTALPRFNKIVANPPYSISSPLILNILEKKFDCAVLTLQKEFCEKLMAREGSKDYGSLSVIASYKADIKCLDQIPRSSFYPQPEVASNIILIELKEHSFHLKDEKLFVRLVKFLFTQRNKKLKNALETFISERIGVDKKEARTLAEDFPYLDSKVYKIRPDEFGEIANKAYEIVKSKRIMSEDGLFYVFPEVYEPSDDTFLLAEWIKREECRRCLDVGTGCGILGILMAKKAEEVVAVDVNPYAVECAKLNVKLNALSDKVKVLRGNLFENVNGKFDMILCNPPYLPCMEDDDKEPLAKAWNGGSSGREVTDQFLKDAPNFLDKDGKILMIQSTLSNPDETIRILEKSHFEVKILAEKKLDFEKLVVIQAIYEG